MSESNIPEVFKGEYIGLDKLKEDLSKKYGPDGNEIPGAGDIKIAITISGGGATGAFEGGVIEVLKNNGIEPDLIIGASAGALNAAGIFYEAMDIQNKDMGSDDTQNTSFVAKLWQHIGRDNNAARYVVDNPALVTTMSRDMAGGFEGKHFNISGIITVIIKYIQDNNLIPINAVNLLLTGIVFSFALGLASFGIGLFGNSIFGNHFAPAILSSFLFVGNVSFLAVAILIICLVLGSLILLVQLGIKAIQVKSIFGNRPLYQTIYHSVKNTGDFDSADELTPEQVRAKAQSIVDIWYGARAHNPKTPEIIFTGTDLTVMSDMLFTLVGADTYSKLIHNDWYAVQLMGTSINSDEYLAQFDPDPQAAKYKGRSMFAKGEMFIDTILSSAAMPPAFPSHSMPLLTITDTANDGSYKTYKFTEKEHYFTDGGILNNSPVHVAIAAGATHVIAIELSDLHWVNPKDFDSERNKETGSLNEYTLIDTLSRTFFTMMSLATSEDIAKSAGWNRAILDAYENNHTISNKRVVQMYRIAPVSDSPVKRVELLDFNGKYIDGQRVTTLPQWMDEGKRVAQGANYWRATVEAYPIKGENTPN